MSVTYSYELIHQQKCATSRSCHHQGRRGAQFDKYIMPELHDALKKEPKIKEWREVVKNEWPPPGMSDGSAYHLND